jgi:hypothetical protein
MWPCWCTTSNNYGCQFAQHFWDDNFYVRRVMNGAWQTWRELIHTGNIGGRTIVRLSPVATTSGTVVDTFGIPSWATRITLVFNAISHNSTVPILIQLGDSGGFETTGYFSYGIRTATTGVAGAVSTVGFNIQYDTATIAYSGTVTLTNSTGNSWVCDGVVGSQPTTDGAFVGGVKTLDGVLDRVRITTTTGTPVFDAGTLTVTYE